jgi:hypothetical protein
VAEFWTLDLIVRVKDSASNRRPKPQPAMSGAPPKPPKRTARGLEDEPPDDEAARQVIKVFSKKLADPNTSAIDQSRCRRVIEYIRKRVGKP